MTKGDKFLIGLLIVASIVSLFAIKKYGLSFNEKYVSVQVDGEEIKQIYFDKKMVGKTIPVETEFGYNLIEMGEDSVRVIEASCPDKLDVKQGSISKPGEIIVCLPNRLIVEIKGERDSKDLDHIVR